MQDSGCRTQDAGRETSRHTDMLLLRYFNRNESLTSSVLKKVESRETAKSLCFWREFFNPGMVNTFI